MADFFVELIDVNKGVNFQIIFGLIIAYILILWIIVVLWTYFDARKRYPNEIYPFIMGLSTFFLGIPFLVFYLLIRPDKEEYSAFPDFDEPTKGGVNIPMINFVGEEGIEMTLNLSVSRKVKDLKPNDLKIDLNIEPSDSKFEVEQIEEINEMIDETKELAGAPKRARRNVMENIRMNLMAWRRRLSQRVEKKNGTKEDHEIMRMVEEKNQKNKKKNKKKGKKK